MHLHNQFGTIQNMKVLGRYGFFTPRPDQAPFYAKREKKRQQQQREAVQAQAEWLAKHKECANGCGKPVAFYDTVHYALMYSGCCSTECEEAMKDKTPSEAGVPFEQTANGASNGVHDKNRGVMGFGEMPREDSVAEQRIRQQAGARYAALARVAAKLGQRMEAQRLAQLGLSEREIAKQLKISPASAHRWIKTPIEAGLAAAHKSQNTE